MLKTENVERRRSRPDICNDILTIALDGARKTRIVYGANLNFQLLREYLDDLKSQGLVVEEGDLVKTTEKGKRFVAHYQGFRQFGITGSYR